MNENNKTDVQKMPTPVIGQIDLQDYKNRKDLDGANETTKPLYNYGLDAASANTIPRMQFETTKKKDMDQISKRIDIKRYFRNNSSLLLEENLQKTLEMLSNEYDMSINKIREIYEEYKRHLEDALKRNNELNTMTINKTSSPIFDNNLNSPQGDSSPAHLYIMKVINDITVNEISFIRSYLLPGDSQVSPDLYYMVKQIQEKYHLSGRELLLVYFSKVNILRNQDKLTKQIDALDAKTTRVLTGQKIPKRKRVKETNLMETNNPNEEALEERGLKLVVETRKEDWKKMVRDRNREPVTINVALNIMTILANSGGIAEAKKELEKSHNFEINKRQIIDIVTRFSPYGQEFAKKTRKYLMTVPERLKNFVLQGESLIDYSQIEQKQDFDTKKAIERLDKLRRQLYNPEHPKLPISSEETNDPKRI
jgi:hypothetical protein